MKKIYKLLSIIISAILIFTPYCAYATGETGGESIEGGSSEVETGGTTEGENTEDEPTDEETEESSKNIKITLDKTELELDVGKEVTLKATVTPSDAEVKIEWSSSNESIATVKNGVVTTGNSAGEAIITVKVIKGTDTVATAECTIKVSRTVNKDATLKSLNINNGKINPEFKSDVYKYNVTVDSNVTVLDFKDLLSKCEEEKKGCQITGNKNLKNGSVVKILVTAENHTAENPNQKTYEFTIVKDTTSLDLKKLEINGYALNESFDPSTLEYTASIPYEIETITVNASAEDSNATVKVTGLTNLKVGTNTVTVTVADEDGNTKKYQIIVTRESEVSVEENPTSIITSSLDNNNDNQSSANSGTISNSNDDNDNFLKYAIVSLACLILVAIGGIGIYFYLKTSPKKLKKQLNNLKEAATTSSMVEVENNKENTKQESSIEEAMQENLVQTREFNVDDLKESSKTDDLFDDDKDV